jgi:Flp pilus assembly pilin Flp
MNFLVLKTWLEARLGLGEHDERGANLVEYVLLLTFIALVVIAIVIALGNEVSEKFSTASDSLDSVPS